jgi:thioesterase superfamily protein 4
MTLRPTEEAENEMVYQNIVIVMELGDGLNGYPSICHGGFVATMLDEICGVLIVLNLEKRMERLKKDGPLQPHTDMAYMTACTSYTMLCGKRRP